MNISQHKAKQIFFDELSELHRVYEKLYSEYRHNPFKIAERDIEYVRGLIYEVAELAEQFGFTVSLLWDENNTSYFRALRGVVITL